MAGGRFGAFGMPMQQQPMQASKMSNFNSTVPQVFGSGPGLSSLFGYGMQPWRMPMFNQPFGAMMPQMQPQQAAPQTQQPTSMPGWQQQFPGATPSNPQALSGAELYLQQNPDVAAAGMDAWAHYNQFGRNEGRQWTGAQPAAPTPAAAQTAAPAAAPQKTFGLSPGELAAMPEDQRRFYSFDPESYSYYKSG